MGKNYTATISATYHAKVENNPNKAVALDEDYDTELSKFNTSVEKICGKLDKVYAQVKAIKNDNDSGKITQQECQKIMKKIKGVKDSLKNQSKKITAKIDNAYKADIKKMVAWYKQQQAANVKTDTTIEG